MVCSQAGEGEGQKKDKSQYLSFIQSAKMISAWLVGVVCYTMPKMQFTVQINLSKHKFCKPQYLMKIFATAFTIATEIHMWK